MRGRAEGPDRPPEGLDLFDGDAYLESLRLPAVKLDGRTYYGRLLSLPEWVRFSARLTAPAAGVSGNDIVDPDRFRALMLDLVRLVFGRGRPWWAFWRPTLAERIVAQSPAFQIAALQSFSRSQTEAFVGAAARVRAATGPTPKTPPEIVPTPTTA